MRRARSSLRACTPSSWQCLPIAVAVIMLCAPRVATGEDPDTPGLAAPATVTGRAALSSAELERFIAVNRVAEPRRQAAADALFEENLGSPNEPIGPALLVILTGMEARSTRINAEACRETGLDCREYAAIARRILQVNELGWLELRQQAVTDGRRRLEAARRAPPRARALESWHALHDVETRSYEVRLASIERRLETRAQARKHQRERSRERAQERLLSMDGVRTQLGELNELRAERERQLLDPRFAASRASLERDIEKIDAVIARLERKLSPHERAAARGPGPEEEVDTSDPELLEARRALDEHRSERPSEIELEDLERGMRDGLLVEEQRIETEAKHVRSRLASASMHQARLDRATVFDRLPELVYLGKPLVAPPPALPAAHRTH